MRVESPTSNSFGACCGQTFEHSEHAEHSLVTYLAQWRTVTVPESHYCAFVLCTDGIADDLEPGAVKEFAWGVFSHYRKYSRQHRGREMRRWLRAWPVPGHSDDKTIACIYRSEAIHE